MESNKVELLAIIGSVATLLGWVIHRIIDYFIKNSNDKLCYIEKLVAVNQKNTESFLAAINHQQTLNRDMQQKTVDALQELKMAIKMQSEMTDKMINLLKHG
ncbi:MAG: hypothetical protein M1275_03225 [Patescibacteria group bacterium]|nr:hypothetical protein [Patescibacteria group bacterium]